MLLRILLHIRLLITNSIILYASLSKSVSIYSTVSFFPSFVTAYPMRIFLFAVLMCSTNYLPAQVSITADMTQSTAEANPLHYGINFQRALAPAIANNADFKARVEEINPGIVRYHAAEQTIPENDKSWVDFANQTWNSSQIDQVLANKPAEAEVIVTITGWPNFISPNQRLPLDLIDTYANFCADLVNIVNNQLGYNVTYWEPFNEKDRAGYDGAEQMAELAAIFQACRAKMLEKDPSIKLVGGAFREPFQSNVQFFLNNLEPGDLDVWSHHQYGGGASNAETNAERIAQIYNRPASIAEGLQVARTKLDNAGFGGVPIWLDEWNIYFSFNLDLQTRYMISAVGGVFNALTFKRAIEEGNADALMSWNAADGTYGKIASDFSQLNPGGHVLAVLREYGVGTVRPTSSSDPAQIEGFTVQDTDGRSMFMLINRGQEAQQVNFSAGGWTPPADVLQFTINQDGLSQTAATWSEVTGNLTTLGANEIIAFVTTGDGTIGNQLPRVDAGGNKKVSAPNTTVTLSGSATDADGTIATYTWTQLEGTTVTTSSTDQPSLALSGLQPDSRYVFQLDVADDQGGVSTDFVTVFTYGPLLGVTVNGTSFENTFAGTTVNGAVQRTTVNFGTQVIQQEELSLTFSGLEQFKTVFQTTLTGGAGLNLRDNASVSFFLKSTTDIGIRVKLIDISGKEINDEQFDLQVPGNNQFQQYELDFSDALSQIDAGRVSSLQIIQSSFGATTGTIVFDALRIGNVATSPDNSLPVASAGPNRIVTLPNDNVQVIDGFGTDGDGAISARQWTQVSGPAATLEGEETPSLSVSDFSAGEYVFAYAVTDNEGATASDQMRLVVVDNPGPARSSVSFLTNSFGGTQINGAVQTTDLGGKVTLSQNDELSLAVSGINQFEKVYRTTLNEEAAVDLSANARFAVDAKSTEAIRLRVKLFDADGAQIDNFKFDIDVPGDATYRTYSLDFSGSFGGVDPTAITRIELMSLTGSSVSGTITIDNLRLGIGRVVADAGPNRLVTLPSGTITITGSDLMEDRVSFSRRWQQISGPSAQLSGIETNTLRIEQAPAGEYGFAYQVTDADGLTASDQTTLFVVENSGPTTVGTTFLKNDFSGTVISDDAQTTAPSGPVTLAQSDELAITLNGIKEFEKAYRTDLTNSAAIDLSGDATFEVDIKSTEAIRLRIKLFDTNGRQIDNFNFDLTIPGDDTYRTYAKNFANEFGNVNRQAISAVELMSISGATISGVLTIDNLQLGEPTTLPVIEPTNVTTVVSSSADDAEENSQGVVDLVSDDLDFRSDNLSAMRFVLNVPAGATIEEASLDLVAKGNSSGANTLTFRAQVVGDATAFTTTSGDLSSRSSTSVSVGWSPGSWTDGETYTSPDLSALIQQLVNRTDYQAGDYLVITVASNAPNSRKRAARTYDFNGSTQEAPELIITYSPATFVEPVGTATVVSSSADDAEENSQGGVDLVSNDLDFRSDNLSAMRFTLDIPAGSSINEASINLVAKDNTSGSNSLVFYAQAVGNASVFAATSNNLSSRVRSSVSVGWSPGSWTDGETYTTPDLSALIQEVVNQSDYQEGNQIVIMVASNAPNSRKRGARTYDYNGSPQEAPELSVTYAPSVAARQGIGTPKGTISPEVAVVPIRVLTYPNPARHEVRFDQLVDVRVLNGRGQEVLTGIGVEQINVTTLPAGLYIVRFATGQVTKLMVE